MSASKKLQAPRELGEVLRTTFIKLNPRDNIAHHVPWESLPQEKRDRYNATARAVLEAARSSP